MIKVRIRGREAVLEGKRDLSCAVAPFSVLVWASPAGAGHWRHWSATQRDPIFQAFRQYGSKHRSYFFIHYLLPTCSTFHLKGSDPVLLGSRNATLSPVTHDDCYLTMSESRGYSGSWKGKEGSSSTVG